MSMIKKFGVLVLILAMLVSIVAGCSSASTTTAASASESSAGTNETTVAPTETEPGPVTIDIGMHVANPEEQESTTWQIIQAFKAKYPYITVNLIAADTDTHVQNMKMAAQAGSLPDVFWMLPATAKEMASAGYLLDLKEYMAQNTDQMTKLADNMKEASNLDGFQFGLPYQPLITGLWYNKALFKQYNVEEPVAGTTFSQLLDMVKVFNDNGIPTIAQGAKSPFSVWAFLIGYARYGYFDKIDAIQAGTEKWNNPDFIKYYEKIAQLRDAGAFPKNIAITDYFESVQSFLDGKVAMLDAGIWAAGDVSNALGEDAGFWWGPVFEDGIGNQKVRMKVSSAPWVVSKDVEKDPAVQAAVFKFLDFYYSDEAAQISLDTLVVPSIDFNGKSSQNSPAFNAVLEQLALPDWVSPVAQPDLVIPEAQQNAMYDSIYGVMVGTYTPEKALDVIDAKTK